MITNPHYNGGNASTPNPVHSAPANDFPGYNPSAVNMGNPFADAVHRASLEQQNQYLNQGQWNSSGGFGNYQEPAWLRNPAEFMELVKKLQHNLNLAFADTLRNMPRNTLTEFLMSQMNGIQGNIMSVPNARQILELIAYAVAKYRTEGYQAQDVIAKMMQDIIPVIAVNWMGHSHPMLPRTPDFINFFNGCADRVRREVSIGTDILEQLGRRANEIRARQQSNQGGYWGNQGGLVGGNQGGGYWGNSPANDYSQSLSNPDAAAGYYQPKPQPSPLNAIGDNSMFGSMSLPMIIEEDGTQTSAVAEMYAAPEPKPQPKPQPRPDFHPSSPMHGYYDSKPEASRSVMGDRSADPFYSAISIGEDFANEPDVKYDGTGGAGNANTNYSHDRYIDNPPPVTRATESGHFHQGPATTGFADYEMEFEPDPSPQELMEERDRQERARRAMQSPIPTGYTPEPIPLSERAGDLDLLNNNDDFEKFIMGDTPAYSSESPSARIRRERLEAMETQTTEYANVDPETLKAIATGNYKPMQNETSDYHELDAIERRDVRMRQSNRLKIVPAYLAGRQRLVVTKCGKHTVIRPENVGDRVKYEEHETELLGSTVNLITGDTGDLSIAENALDRALKAQTISEYKEIIDAKLEEGKADDVETLLSDTPAITITDTLIGERNGDYLTPALVYIHNQLADAGEYDVEQMVINYNLRTVKPILVNKADIDALGFITRAKTAASVAKHIQSFNEKTSLPQRTLAELHSDATAYVNRAIQLEFNDEWSITTLTGDLEDLAEAVEEEFGDEGIQILNTIYAESARQVYRAYTYADLEKEGSAVIDGVDLTEGDEETAVLGTVENITLVPFAYADLPIAFSGDFGTVSKQLNAKLYDVLQERIHENTNPHVGQWKFVTTDNVVYTFCKATAGTEIFIVRN